VELSNYGELFLNPELPKIMEHAFTSGVQLTADNGANLNTVREETLEALVKFRFRRITCSIDGASAETYVRYRVGGCFETVIANIRKIQEYKSRYGSRYPRLAWQFISFPHNQHEIEPARKLARQLVSTCISQST
jgi:MoaA/NifB/PqqE/SkfB family radical SAM enzyme